jgi:hypothetical protein
VCIRKGSGHRFIDRRTQEDTFVRETLCVFEQIGAIRKSPLPTVERLRRFEPRLIVVRASLADRERFQAIGTRRPQQLDHRKDLAVTEFPLQCSITHCADPLERSVVREL